MVLKNKVGLGTSIFGTKPEFKSFQDNVLDTAINIGYRLFDTGETYANGVCEEMVGDAILRSGLPRSNFEIVTKMHPMHVEAVACRQSLERLKTDYIDVYLIHFLLPQHSNDRKISLFIEGLVKLKQEGLIKNFGFSNFKPEEMEMWFNAEDKLGLPVEDRAKVCQYQYSLVKRSADIKLHKLLKDKGFTAMPHSPFGGGRASGSSRPPQPGYHGDFWHLPSVLALEPIAREVGCTVPQLILAFLNRNENSVIFPRSFKGNNLDTNFHSTDFIPKITKSIYDKIEALFPLSVVDPTLSQEQISAIIEENKRDLPQ